MKSENVNLYDALQNYTPRSAWMQGVKALALEITDSAENIITELNAKQIALNGADSFLSASQGGQWAIYDCDIAARFCTYSELERTHNGEKNPNGRETWLEVQARAASQAVNLINKALNSGSVINKWN